MDSQDAFGLQFRLLDRFGDNGVISIVIGRRSEGAILLDTWLMSCRVLGRQVEEAVLNVVADVAKSWGATALIGEYHPTSKNGMKDERALCQTRLRGGAPAGNPHALGAGFG